MRMFETRDLCVKKICEKKLNSYKKHIFHLYNKTKDIDCLKKKSVSKNVDIRSNYKMRCGTLKSIY